MLKRFAVFAAVAGLATPLLAVGSTAAPAGAAVKNALTVTAQEYAFTTQGHLHPGQAQVTFKNSGKEPHILALLKLKPGVTLKQVKKALNSKDQNAFQKLGADPNGAYGYPFFLTPGGAATTVTDLLKAGNYAMICFLADAHGTPHFMRGMLQLLTIAGKPVKSQPIKSDGTIVVNDTAVQGVPTPLPASATFEIRNEGTAIHSFGLVKLNGSATVPDIDKYFSDYKGGPFPSDAPGEVLTDVGDFPGGQHVYLTWKNLPAGRYGYASISGDSSAPGGDDVAKGLYGETSVS
jgi:hypothetical protein